MHTRADRASQDVTDVKKMIKYLKQKAAIRALQEETMEQQAEQVRGTGAWCRCVVIWETADIITVSV